MASIPIKAQLLIFIRRRWKIDLRIAPVATIWLLPLVVPVQTFTTPRNFILWLGITSEALAFALIIWFFWGKILKHFGRPTLTFFQLTFLGVVGGISAFGVYSFWISIFNLVDIQSLEYGLPQAAILGATALPALCITATTSRRIDRLHDEVDWIFEFEKQITDEKRQTLEDKVALVSQKILARSLSIVRVKSIVKLEKAIPAISNYSAALFEKSDQRHTNILLRLINSQRRRTKVRFILRSLQSKPPNPLVFTFFFIGPLILYFFQENGFYHLFPWTSLIIAEVLGLKFVDRALWKRGVKFPIPHFWLTFVATLALLSLTILKIPTINHDPMTSWKHLISVAVCGYDFIFLSVLGAMVQVGLNNVDQIVTSRLIRVSSRAATKYAESKYLAQYAKEQAELVHRKVQSILIKGAFESRGLSGSQYQEFLRGILKEIDLLFRRELQVKNDSTPSFRESLFNLARHWEPLINVTIAEQQLESIVVSADQGRTIYSVIEDALVNAHRHGGATQAWIEFSQVDEGALRLRVRNNGSPVIKQSPGLGSLNFKRATANSWSLRNDGDSVLLEATFRSS